MSIFSHKNFSLELDTKGRLFLGKSFNNEYLTKRELEILKCVLKGYSAKQIGLYLKISYRTVETYITILKFKLRCHKKGELISICVELGLLKIF